MTVAVDSGQALEAHLSKPNVIAIGPGLGQTAWSEQMPKTQSDSCLNGLDQSLDVKARASMGEVTEQLKSDQPIWVGASMLLPSKSKI